jgi:hypothetical protein
MRILLETLLMIGSSDPAIAVIPEFSNRERAGIFPLLALLRGEEKGTRTFILTFMSGSFATITFGWIQARSSINEPPLVRHLTAKSLRTDTRR